MQDSEGLMDGPCLLDFGSRLGRWHKKCLQAAVLGLCRDSAREVLETRLLRTCSNNRGSGAAGGQLEASNFRSVGKVLHCSGKRVCVLDAQCTADVFAGRLLGVWSLGSTRGSCLGTLVWSRSDEHVYVVDGDCMQAWAASRGSHSCVGCAPWTACNVGSPKKKGSNRGAHLKGVGNKVTSTKQSEQRTAESDAIPRSIVLCDAGGDRVCHH